MGRRAKYKPQDLAAAVVAVQSGSSVANAARTFKVPRTTLNRALDKIRETGAMPIPAARLVTAEVIDTEAHRATAEVVLAPLHILGHQITGLQGNALEALGKALEAERFVGMDEDGHPVFAPDHAVRVKAAAELLDRGGILPKVRTVRTEPDDGPSLATDPGEIRARIEKRQRLLAELEGGEE